MRQCSNAQALQGVAKIPQKIFNRMVYSIETIGIAATRRKILDNFIQVSFWFYSNIGIYWGEILDAAIFGRGKILAGWFSARQFLGAVFVKGDFYTYNVYFLLCLIAF